MKDPEVIRFVVEAFVIVAFVVVELPTIKLVMLAKVATRDEMKELVEVALVVEAFVATKVVAVALVAVRLVNAPVIAVRRLAKKVDEVAFVVDALVAKRLVAVALVRLADVEKRLVAVKTDDEAKVVDAFVAVKLVDVAEVVTRADMVVVARVACPVTPRVPATPRRYPGVDDPIPTFPLAKTFKNDTPVDDATLRIAFVSPELPIIETRDDVDVVPIERAESHPEPINIAVSVAEPPVIDPMLSPMVVPVAAPDPTNGIVIPLKIPPAEYVVGDWILIID